MLRAVRIINRSLRRDQAEVTPLTGLQTTGKGKPIFGIDIGNQRSRLSVFDPVTKKPRLVRNIQDNSDFWHSVIAKNGNDLIVGKNAFSMIQHDPANGLQRVKSLLGQNMVVIQSNQYQPAELVAQIFKAMGQSAAAYLQQNNVNEPMEAYVSVPYTFTPHQREELLHAAEIAGIKIVKLVEEPLAILNSTWRLEQNGQYLLADFGENFRASVMRVFDGQYDVLGHVEDKAIREAVDQAVLNYVYEKLVKVKPVKYMLKSRSSVEAMLRPYVQQINEQLVTEVETSVIIDEVVIFVSREARALVTHLPLRNVAATLGELMTQSGVLASEFTHSILVGGNSLTYPGSAEAVERETHMATSRTVAPPASALAIGTALYGAREQGLLQPHFFRDRTVERSGHVRNVTKVTKPQSYAEFEGQLRSGTALPLPVAINFNDVMAKTKLPPLNPVWDESLGKPEAGTLPKKVIEDYRNPVLSLSFAKTPDPFTGSQEYYARVNVQAIADDFKSTLVSEGTDKSMIFKKVKWMHPYERLGRAIDYTRPMLKMHIVIDLSATDYVSMAPEIPEFETWEEFINKADLEEKFQINRLLLGRDPNIEKFEKEGKVQLLKYMKEQLQKPYYRQLNRVHDAVQFIMSQMERHDIIAVSMRTKEGLQNLLPFTNSEDIEHTKLFNTILDTFPGANVDHASAAKFAHDSYTEQDVEVFDEFRDFLELRTVVLTDTVPDYKDLENIKNSIQEANESKCVNTTFISVSGRKFDSAIVKTIESVRGANYLEFRNVFSDEFRKTQDKRHGAMFLNSVLPRFYDVKVWVDFENYKVDKVYGYDYQVSPYYKDEIKQEAVVDPEGRTASSVIVERDFAKRLEGKTPQLYVKTLFGSYHHDRQFVEDVDRANWDELARKRVIRRDVKLEEDPRSFLFKLQKKPTAVERKSTWEYNPLSIIGELPFSKNKDVALYRSDYTDTRSEYTVRIQYTDRSGSVRNFTRVNKLTDTIEYEELGVRKAVLAARYIETVRRMVHNRHVTLSGRESPEIPALSERTGITTLTAPQEKQLFDYYLNNLDLDLSYYTPKTPQINEADLPMFTKFSHYYNSEFKRLFNPIEQWYWPRMPLNYAKDNEQISMQCVKNLAFEYNKKKIERDAKAQKSFVRNRFIQDMPIQPIFDMLMFKNYRPYQMPKFENVYNELELHREWDRKEIEGSKMNLRFLRIINYLRWNTRYLAAWLRDYKKDYRENDPAGALAYRVLLQTMEGKLWMRSKNYWAQLLTYQHNHQKRSRKMDAVIKKNDVVRVNNILWAAKVDVDNFIAYLRKVLPEDKRDDLQLNALRQEMDQYIFERMSELDPEITLEAKRNMYEPEARDYQPEEIDPVQIEKNKEDDEFGELPRAEMRVKIDALPEDEDRLWQLAEPDAKRDLGRKKWKVDREYAKYLTDEGLAKKKRQDALKRKREQEKKRKEKEEMTGGKS